jgi:hypothetical protein
MISLISTFFLDNPAGRLYEVSENTRIKTGITANGYLP